MGEIEGKTPLESIKKKIKKKLKKLKGKLIEIYRHPRGEKKRNKSSK